MRIAYTRTSAELLRCCLMLFGALIAGFSVAAPPSRIDRSNPADTAAAFGKALYDGDYDRISETARMSDDVAKGLLAQCRFANAHHRLTVLTMRLWGEAGP